MRFWDWKQKKNRKNKILCLKKMDEQQLHRCDTKDKIYICMPSLFLWLLLYIMNYVLSMHILYNFNLFFISNYKQRNVCEEYLSTFTRKPIWEVSLCD